MLSSQAKLCFAFFVGEETGSPQLGYVPGEATPSLEGRIEGSWILLCVGKKLGTGQSGKTGVWPGDGLYECSLVWTLGTSPSPF